MHESSPAPAASAPAGDNPFFEDWTGPFGTPPFGRIAPGHFGPAYDRAFAAHDAEVAVIAANPEAPSFDNTIAALELSGRLLSRVDGAFHILAGAHTNEALLEIERDDGGPVSDLTRDPPSYPAPRDARLQALARGDEGFLLSLGYATQRGYGHTHPFAAEIRMGWAAIEIVPEELGFPIVIGDVQLTECQMVNQFKGGDGKPPQFTRGYGQAFGHGERKARAMALVDRALRSQEIGDTSNAPTHDQEFVLSHCDNVEASGFTQHLKLPHYVDFQSELNLLRGLRADFDRAAAEPVEPEPAK